MQYLNIGHLVKGDDIGLLSLKDGQSLFGRTGMRLPNRQLVVGMGLIPLLNEGFVERREQFTGNVVGGVEQIGRSPPEAGAAAEAPSSAASAKPAAVFLKMLVFIRGSPRL